MIGEEDAHVVVQRLAVVRRVDHRGGRALEAHRASVGKLGELTPG
jgi:hypothetical protein